MKKQRKTGGVVLSFIELFDECACRKLLIDLVRGPKCRYCGRSIPERHLDRFYSGLEVYCQLCNSKFFAVGGTIISQTKLTYRQILKILVMLDLGFRTKEIANAVNVGTHTIARWKKKLSQFISLKEADE
jgi:transposase-like protein